ncbi:MAG: pantoate--beta-alanine ligase [Thermoguttaceae bacterium]|nr:pantoate--beta-alanine ligase [Thermoguttaceae bacterium]MDW8078531.1 pantoate--beta-alanine ligase [Thermoguttaceae bacterium]
MHTDASRPQLFRTVTSLRAFLLPWRRNGKRIGFVPTMGALHEGHLSLVRASKAENDCTVVSIYVNPTQFAPSEDFARYPRNLAGDLELLSKEGVEAVFAPDDTEMYPPGFNTWVEVRGVSEPLEGQCRPGHFRGVATVVVKLFNIVQPDVTYFGAKDYQQSLVVRQLIRDLNLPIELRVLPTVREPDGLAMSSRNSYLSPQARQKATVIWKSLKLAQELVEAGEKSPREVIRRMEEVILSAEGAMIDYVALVDPETLAPVEVILGPTLAAVAVRLEGTRLIDNMMLCPKG